MSIISDAERVMAEQAWVTYPRHSGDSAVTVELTKLTRLSDEPYEARSRVDCLLPGYPGLGGRAEFDDGEVTLTGEVVWDFAADMTTDSVDIWCDWEPEMPQYPTIRLRFQDPVLPCDFPDSDGHPQDTTPDGLSLESVWAE